MLTFVYRQSESLERTWLKHSLKCHRGKLPSLFVIFGSNKILKNCIAQLWYVKYLLLSFFSKMHVTVSQAKSRREVRKQLLLTHEFPSLLTNVYKYQSYKSYIIIRSKVINIELNFLIGKAKFDFICSCFESQWPVHVETSLYTNKDTSEDTL